MTAALNISVDGSFVVTVKRNDAVSNVLWSKVTAEWGVDGDPARAIRTPVDTFLSNIDWLLPYCRKFDTGVTWSDDARALVQRAVAERGALSAVLRDVRPLTPAEVTARLANSRFKRVLQPFQTRDLAKLMVLQNGANFSVPGAGKTTVTYALYEAEHVAGKVDRLLVVAPLSAFEAWIDEVQECFHNPPVVHRLATEPIPPNAEVLLVNYQRLHPSYKKVAAWAQGGKCHVVLDEAHRMKRGWAGQWGRASLNLAYFAARRDVLTGTPAPQALRDLDAIFDFAWPSQARRILPPPVFLRTPPPGLTAQTAGTIRPLFVRTTKSELNLRKPKIEVRTFPLVGLQRDIYTALRNQYAGKLALARGDRTALARMGYVTMYLLEAATNPALLPLGRPLDPAAGRPRFPLLELPENGNLADLIGNYAQYEVPPKFTTLAAMVAENAAADRKTLVWTNFVSNIEVLAATFRTLQPAVIHGGIPTGRPREGRPTREQELDRFRNDKACALLLANPAATSEGISLHHDCHDAIYLDRTFNAGHYLQSIDRIHRLGMPDLETRVTILATLGTVDITVDNQVDTKASRLGAILSDGDIAAMALPDDEDYKEVVGEEDVAALFAHLRGEDSDMQPVRRP